MDSVYDAVTMIVALDESLVTKSVMAEVTIDLEGEHTKGAFAIHWEGSNPYHDQFYKQEITNKDGTEKPKKKSKIILDLDGPKAIARIIESVYSIKDEL